MSQVLCSILFLLYVVLCNTISSSHVSGRTYTSQDLVRSSCFHSTFPHICLRTLSSYSGPANSLGDLAQAAVLVSLKRAAKTSTFLKARNASTSPIGGRQRGALRDCVELMADSVDELTRTLTELRHLRAGAAFEWHLSNAQTWASAALTNGDTCLDGFHEAGGAGNLQYDVWRRVRNVARVTSNALYLINALNANHAGLKPRSNVRS